LRVRAPCPRARVQASRGGLLWACPCLAPVRIGGFTRELASPLQPAAAPLKPAGAAAGMKTPAHARSGSVRRLNVRVAVKPFQRLEFVVRDASIKPSCNQADMPMLQKEVRRCAPAAAGPCAAFQGCMHAVARAVVSHCPPRVS
jgi:hypothetical protein